MNRSRLHVAHTADLTRQDLAAARALIFEVFDDATDDDWEHCLEVKSGSASLSSGQRAFDAAVNGGEAASAMPNGRPIERTSTDLVRVR